MRRLQAALRRESQSPSGAIPRPKGGAGRCPRPRLGCVARRRPAGRGDRPGDDGRGAAGRSAPLKDRHGGAGTLGGVVGRWGGRTGRAVVIWLGVGPGDTPEGARWLAEKCAGLRIFEDAQGKTNLALGDVGGEAIVVSQFTLYADARKGRRPSFIDAAPPERAGPAARFFAQHLAAQGVPTQQGAFGAHMLVEIANDGPVTILLDRAPDGP